MDNITIEVLQEDIDNGTQSDVNSCPVALALKRNFPKADDIIVAPDWAEVYQPRKKFLILNIKYGNKSVIKFPRSVRKFIINFDVYGRKDQHVKPFTFEAEIDKGK